MKVKTFKNLREQILILRSKGLTINDEEKAMKILFRENYFFLSGYRHLLIDPNIKDHYIEGSTFEELYALFVFDRKIRNIMFKNILVVENNIKSIVSYQLSKKYGYKEKDYLSPKNFNDDRSRQNQVNDIIFKMKRQIRLNSKQHSATLHYISKYGYIPLWVSVKVLSFGIIAELYSILKSEDQIDIADYYNVNVESLSTYLTLLANFRNLCAHEDILYDLRTQRSIPNSKYHLALNIDMIDDEYTYGKNDLYALIIIMKQMLTIDEFRELIYEIGYEIDILDGKIDSVPLNSILNKIGFPDNWRDIINIK